MGSPPSLNEDKSSQISTAATELGSEQESAFVAPFDNGLIRVTGDVAAVKVNGRTLKSPSYDSNSETPVGESSDPCGCDNDQSLPTFATSTEKAATSAPGVSTSTNESSAICCDCNECEPDTCTTSNVVKESSGGESGFKTVVSGESDLTSFANQTPVPFQYNDEEAVTEVDDEGYDQDGEYATNPRTSIAASEANSFDQVGREIENELKIFRQANKTEARDLSSRIPERNGDRLLSEEASVFMGGPDLVDDEDTEVAGESIASSDRYGESKIMNEVSESGDEVNDNEDEVKDSGAEVYENSTEMYGSEDEVQENEQSVYSGEEESVKNEELQAEETEGDNETEGEKEAEEDSITPREQQGGENESENDPFADLPAPPSFIFRTERSSKNFADAITSIWDKFWSEDMRQIVHIIKSRFSQLLPYIRKFFAHLVAFWGGINYIRRALAAFVRILKRDERVKELMERIGWASKTTVKLFLSICTMIMQAALQVYYLFRDRIIPDARRVIPILYYKAITQLIQVAQHSPWALVFGPFSLTFAIDAEQLPDRFYLHNKLYVPQDDITFGHTEVRSFVQSIAETIQRKRSRIVAKTSSRSTAVYTQTTDEAAIPPPSQYTESTQASSALGYSNRKSGSRNFGQPLTEVTNQGNEWTTSRDGY